VRHLYAVALFVGLAACGNTVVDEPRSDCPVIPALGCKVDTDCPPGDNYCAVVRCDEGACAAHLRNPGDIVPDSTPGDCSHFVCGLYGDFVKQYHADDTPDAGDCHAGICPTETPPPPITNGNLCSAGICKEGACVSHITVMCETPVGIIYGCGPEQSPEQAVMWTGLDGKAHACMGNVTGQLEYCKPGTECYGYLFGVQHKGACVDK
jgi:hypothetical protein